MYIQYILHGGTLQQTERVYNLNTLLLSHISTEFFCSLFVSDKLHKCFLCLVLCLLPYRASKHTLNGALE